MERLAGGWQREVRPRRARGPVTGDLPLHRNDSDAALLLIGGVALGKSLDLGRFREEKPGGRCLLALCTGRLRAPAAVSGLLSRGWEPVAQAVSTV